MKPSSRFALLIVFIAALVVGHGLAGCAAQPNGNGNSSTSSGVGGQGGGQGGAGATTSGSGGAGAQGGAPNPCGTDCTTIQTPDCQVAQCNAQTGQCEVVPAVDGTTCDDGEFCTADDSCAAGLCVGGPPNDCGLSPAECEEIVCDEQSKTCSAQGLADGSDCTPSDLCMVNASCSNGLCIGTPKDCFFAPVPDDCHISECNPQNGQCEPVPGNEGQACVDLNDLCTIGKICAAGVCQGGQPKDCSQLTQGCNLGVCDVNTGQCVQQAVQNGDPCDDLDACTNNETCQSGNCTGGQPVTQCIDNDGCCPGSCNPSTDIDCACNVTKIRFTELFIGSPDYVLLHNPTQCALDLDPLEILFDDSSSTDLAFPLPAHVLQPGASVYVIESGATGTDIPTGSNIMFSSSRGGAAILCDGACNPADGSNVVDVVAFSEGEPHGPLPSGITFNPAGLTGINQSTESYLRVATQGTKPTFLASDWSIGPKSK